MNTRLHTSIAIALIGLSSIAVAHKAEACGLTNLHRSANGHWSLPAYLPSSNPPAAAKTAAAASQKVRSSINPLRFLEPIAGLYQFTFTSDGSAGIPDGAVVDQGFVIWHVDGTEVMNSGRPPVTQSFCMGAWERTGVRSYKLNHYALSWDSTGTMFVGPTNIRENIQLDRGGNFYSGTFSINQYAPDGETVLAHVQGNVSGTRLTADSN